MNIEIIKSQDHYRADLKDLPGTPPIGLGESPEMAVACLFWRLNFEKIKDNGSWFDYIREDKPIVVNGKIWEYPKSYYTK